MQGEKMDWQRIDELRKIFLGSHGQTGISNYWDSTDLLGLYDQTLGQRILWKWRAVWNDLEARGWTAWKRASSVGDWGCGTGIATRSMCERWQPDVDVKITMYDRSEKAALFAATKLKEEFAIADVASETKKMPPSELLLISHVANELSPAARSELLKSVKQAQCIVWVEPGTSEASRILMEMREMLRKQFFVIAPCVRQTTCPLANNRRDWCHQFAQPPREVFHDAFWSEFSRRLKIDIGSVPLSYLVLQKGEIATIHSVEASTVGSPRRLKHGEESLICADTGELRRVNCTDLKQVAHSEWSVTVNVKA